MGSSAWRVAADGIARRCGAGMASAVVGAAAWRAGQGGCPAGGGLTSLRETARRSRRLAASAARRTRAAAHGAAARAGWTRHTPAATRRRRVGVQYAVGTLAVAGAGFVRAKSHRRQPAAPAPRGGSAGTALAVTAVWLALVAPGQYSVWGIQDFLRLPVAAIGLGAAALLVPWPAMCILGVGFGAVLAALVMVRGLNLGFRKVMTRPFDITNDWTYLRDGVETLATFAGRAAAGWAVAGAVVVTTAVSALVPWASLRMASAIGRHPGRALPAVVGAAAAWGVLRWTGIGWPHGYYTAKAASTAMIRMARETVQVIPRNLADRKAFRQEISADAAADRPAAELVAGLRGKDVVVVFLEGLGRLALEDPRLSGTVLPALSCAGGEIAAAGFSAFSAWVDSPTSGAGSWLAHATAEAGLWVNTQRRYNQLLVTGRLTLSQAFRAAGWRTVFVVPSTDRPWPQGRPFYGFDTLYTKFNLGYRGQPYGYATMPDQYLYRAFAVRELRAERRAPVFAQIDTLSSHYPWTPPPPLLAWEHVGDGQDFAGPEPADGDRVQVYADAIAYTVRALAQFVARSGDPNLVVLALGDHQPNRTIAPRGAGRQTPIMLIGGRETVSPAAAGWGWRPGVIPSADAPVWRMSEIRDRIFAAFGGGRLDA